ncbi:hypothetical protein LINPERPRIM_LOCUS30543 [Linum perenne]
MLGPTSVHVDYGNYQDYLVNMHWRASPTTETPLNRTVTLATRSPITGLRTENP